MASLRVSAGMRDHFIDRHLIASASSLVSATAGTDNKALSLDPDSDNPTLEVFPELLSPTRVIGPLLVLIRYTTSTPRRSDSAS